MVGCQCFGTVFDIFSVIKTAFLEATGYSVYVGYDIVLAVHSNCVCKSCD